MARFQKGNKIGNRFSSTNQPKKSGRKPMLYTQLKEVYEISYEEYKKVIMHIMNSTQEEIIELKNNPKSPMWVVNICAAILTDTSKGITTILSEVTDRLFGKPKQINENINDNIERNKATIVFVKENEE